MVRKYIHRGTGNVVEAVCFYGEMKEVIDFIGKDRKAIFNNGAFAIESDSGCGRLSTCVNIGDYVVKSDIDEICVFTPSVFERVYGKYRIIDAKTGEEKDGLYFVLKVDAKDADERRAVFEALFEYAREQARSGRATYAKEVINYATGGVAVRRD